MELNTPFYNRREENRNVTFQRIEALETYQKFTLYLLYKVDYDWSKFMDQSIKLWKTNMAIIENLNFLENQGFIQLHRNREGLLNIMRLEGIDEYMKNGVLKNKIKREFEKSKLV